MKSLSQMLIGIELYHHYNQLASTGNVNATVKRRLTIQHEEHWWQSRVTAGIGHAADTPCVFCVNISGSFDRWPVRACVFVSEYHCLDGYVFTHIQRVRVWVCIDQVGLLDPLTEPLYFIVFVQQTKSLQFWIQTCVANCSNNRPKMDLGLWTSLIFSENVETDPKTRTIYRMVLSLTNPKKLIRRYDGV